MRTPARDRRSAGRVSNFSILRTLEAAGIEFIPENGGGAGGRFSLPARKADQLLHIIVDKLDRENPRPLAPWTCASWSAAISRVCVKLKS